jgi:uncharacterized membrane protein HdeD (DUF308 family)
MSGTQMVKPGRSLGYADMGEKWGWFVGLGAAMLLLGIFALGDVAAVTLISTIFIGAMLLVGGVIQAIHAFMVKTWSGFLLNMLGGIVYAIGGILQRMGTRTGRKGVEALIVIGRTAPSP